MPEGWIHAVYSIDTCASVNFWWNQPAVNLNEDFKMEIVNETDFGLDAYDKFRSTNVAPVPVPPGIVLAKSFDTRDNEGRFFGEGTKVPCQACTSKEHEYDKCPYLGHYRYKRISGQSCDYSQYELIETQAAPSLATMDLSDIFSNMKDYKPINKPLVPIPQGITLANNFNNRDNVMKSQSNVQWEHIDCQACGSKTHELGGCPYLGYYETNHIMGQACDYSGYRLKKPLDQPTPQLLEAPLQLVPSIDLLSPEGYTPVNRLTPIIPPGLVLAKEFRNTSGFMSQPKTPCQACNAEDHAFDKCPYLGYYKHKTVCGQVCNYEHYILK